jgi:hypothetical protein
MTAGSPDAAPRMAGERSFPLVAGLPAPLVIGLAVALVVEGAILHQSIASHSERWAWTLTAVNAATLLWLWRDYTTSSRSMVVVRDDEIEIAAGTRMRSRIARSAIGSAEAATWRSVPDLPTDYINVSKPTDPNVMLVLREAAEVELPLGLRRRVTRIGLRVPNAGELLAAIA